MYAIKRWPLGALLILAAAFTFYAYSLNEGGIRAWWFTSSGNAERREVISLLDQRRFAGIAQEYVPKLRIRPSEEYAHVLPAMLTPAMDFRRIKVASTNGKKRRHAFQGLECRNHYIDDICPVPGQCADAADDRASALRSVAERGPCLSWGRGKVPLFTSEPLQQTYTSASLQDWDAEGEWQGPLYKPSSTNSRQYRLYTPSEIRQCLAGKRILFHGDSMMRQLFGRLVTFSRFIPAYIEEAYTAPATYTVFKNGTDFFEVSEHLEGEQTTPLTKADSDSAIFQAYFHWAPLSDIVKPEGLIRDFQKYQPDLAFLGYNYWFNKADDFTTLPDVIKSLYTTLEWHGSLAFYATPPVEGLPPWQYVSRNAVIRSYVTYNRILHGPQRQMVVVPADKIAMAADRAQNPQRTCAHWPNGANECISDLHWSATFLAHPPEPILAGLDAIKAPLHYDCRDLFNLNVLQNWFNAICH